MTKTRKVRTDSVSGQVALARMAKVEQYPGWPTGLVTQLEDPVENSKASTLYAQMLTARAPSDWRAADLPIVARAAMTLVEIDRYEVQFRLVGPLVKGGKSGNTPVSNPMSMHIGFLYGKFKQLANHIGLSSLPMDSRQLGSHAKAYAEAVDVVDNAKAGAAGLIA